MKHLLEEWNKDSQWSAHRAEEVAEYIRIDSPRLLDRPPIDVLNLKNCLLDVTTGRTSDHTPDHLSSVQSPVDYDPTAKCPAWDQFVSETFLEDSQDVAFEIVAWLMTPDTSLQRMFTFGGRFSGDGKFLFLADLAALGEFFSRDYTGLGVWQEFRHLDIEGI